MPTPPKRERLSSSRFLLLLLVTAATASAGAAPTPATDQPTTRREAAAEWTADGMQKVEIKGLDLVYAKPGSQLSGFTKVLLKPTSVSFRRNWERSADQGSRIRPADAQRIKDGLAELLRTEVTRELTAAGYPVVEAPDNDVLEVQVSIIDLFITAPDLPSTGMTRTYALSVGEMTMVADLRDAASGETLMRVYDQHVGRDLARMRFITRGENVAEARRAAAAWASALRKQLELSRALGAAR